MHNSIVFVQRCHDKCLSLCCCYRIYSIGTLRNNNRKLVKISIKLFVKIDLKISKNNYDLTYNWLGRRNEAGVAEGKNGTK